MTAARFFLVSAALTTQNASIPNYLVDNVTCYICTARHNLSDDEVSTSFETFFESDEKFASNEFIFSYSKETATRQRGDNRISNDSSDMFVKLQALHESNVSLPVFICNGYKMPPSSGIIVLAEQI